MGLNIFKKKNKCEDCNGDLKRLQDLTKRYSELMWIKSNKVSLSYWDLFHKLSIFQRKNYRRYSFHDMDKVERALGTFVDIINLMDSKDMNMLIDIIQEIDEYRKKSVNLDRELQDTINEINQLKAKLKI